jgi:EAL domain-containing protein (putative c-di-GMP-specific phosphodiesterase class I)
MAFAALGQLRAIGVRVWLDDFGTGFSGLSHLRRARVDGVKIDRSFITDILTDPEDLALASAIIAMAHSLGMQVIAEGVECEAQFTLLRARDCNLAQGFWMSEAVPAEDLVRCTRQVETST